MSDSVFAQFTADDDQLAVGLLVQPAINAALVHNRVPLVRHLTLVNNGAVPLTDVTLTLELLGPDGALTEPWTRTLAAPLRPGASTSWDDFRDFTPDRVLLYRTDEAFPVDYRLTVKAAEAAEAVADHNPLTLVAPSRVLAHNEWFNSPALYDSLAAFVQPNTRAVEAVLRAAAQLLLARTGSGSLQGYQEGSERAALIAGAVYEALRQLEITYQTLPASFENTGQKVRTTAAVLDGRLGNCIDLSVTYAACLEAAGLHPLVFISEGHAFGGFLLEDERLGSAALTESNLLISMVDSGRAVPVELTRIGPGAQSATFTEAVRVGLGHFRGDGERMQGVVDVHLAHRSGIRPLPSADELVTTPLVQEVTADAGASLDLPPGVAAAKLRQLADEGEEVPHQSDGSPARVQQWKKSLLDLSLRNPLLNLPKRGRGLDLHVPAGALPLLDDLIHDGRQVQVIPQDDISHVHELAGARRAQDLDAEILTRELRTDRRVYGAVTDARYKTAMRALQREARTMEQETGSNYLYLTIGTLVHTKTTGGEAYAPLFLLPVRIEGGSGRRPYAMVIDGTEVASPNYCLIEWLRVKHSVRIPELEQPVLDEHGIDIAKTLAAINTGLLDNRLNYRIDETASLRLLQFSTFQMWRDLTDHWPLFMENPVVRHLVESSGATFDDPARPEHDVDVAVDEADLHLPIPADGSQMQAIVRAERGHSFVLEGPPGTGKSQTITNMIARAVSAGRSVLFVAEKQAALEVVKRRLKQVGLGPFALDLHGRKQSLNAIRQQLRDALDQYDQGGDGTWTAVETAYRTRLAPLTDYPAQVHTTNPVGMSLWSAYEQTLAYGDGPVAPIPVSYLHAPAEARAQVETTLREFPAAARSARLRAAHPWALSGCRALDGLHGAAVTEIAAELERLRADLAAHPHLVDLLRTLPAPESVSELQAGAWFAVRGMLPDRETTLHASDRRWDEAVARLQADLAAFRQGFAGEFATFRPDVFARPELTAWDGEAQEAAKKLFGKRKRRQAVADRLAVHLVAGATLDVERAEVITGRLVAAQAQAAGLYQHVLAVGGLRLPQWQPTDPNAQERLTEAIDATRAGRTLLARHPQAWELFQRGFTDGGAVLLDRFASRWRAWRGVLRSAGPELALWAAGTHWFDAWQRDGATWLHELQIEELFPLRRWATVLTHADVLASAGLTDFRDQLLRAEVPAQLAEEVYRRGVAAASLAERVRAGGLQYFDPELHDDEINQFEVAAGELRSALPTQLPAVLVRRRPFSPTDRRGRFADFAAELRRKRGGRSFRELFEQYPDAVLALTPCVLVSPASAANFLAPGSQRFDLVIFDEASQIRVAEAVGAMGRGSAVVVVGDSRQMPPSSIMQASHSVDEVDEGNGPVPEDLESILSEAVESGLPQRWLSWHYRSHDESLIAFSNRYYYDNKLSSLPSPGATSSAGVSWRRVDGRYDRGGSRTNEVEARAILADITRRLHDPATDTQSVGVVTFNIQQRDLILNLLEESTDPIIREHLSGAVAEPIFVKNLENVQGDERDVVLFSLAFSTNLETGQLPLNFGPLSQAGGERRLNVAITRARRQVVLYSSFDPSDIDLSRTSALGTQHLRAYCEMAAAGADRLGDLATDRTERRSRIRDEVAGALRDRGHEVRTSHGLSDFTVDIAVRRPGSPTWQVAVMLDGPDWSARPTVADRDSAPTLLRSIMGWPEVVRFWLPAWIHDRSALLDRVDDAVTRAEAPATAEPEPESADAPYRDVELPQPRSATDVEPPHPAPASELPQPRLGADEEPLLGAVPAPVTGLAVESVPSPVAVAPTTASGTITASPFIPYVPTPLGEQADLDLLATDQRVRGLMRNALREIIEAEGPIEQHRLARLALARFGFLRTREDRRSAVLALVDSRRLHTHPTVSRYAWPEGADPQTHRAYRVTQTSNDRAFEEVPPEEVANAFVHVLQGVPSMDEERLLRAGLERLGYRRRTDKIDKLLRYGLHVAVTSGRLRFDSEGRITLG
ncbi:DUF4011 domain-containing protein [Micromonospora parathelypteridis]|uniref:AAA domain-containing protein n=1 Tax=Micromonospora parathelypteridis TaxID=1839617 RepID=A0A840VGE3_9ACTN|nr:DUF4011 domain-containing protein [Micromonospora parathelypteridis]MBB5475863.1 hypothetical protein [Micromonospora parathelypteridis]GGO31802.1 DNA helicase [Micromonospora parathelypteridis]